MLVPVAVRFETVDPEHSVWEALPVGAVLLGNTIMVPVAFTVPHPPVN